MEIAELRELSLERRKTLHLRVCVRVLCKKATNKPRKQQTSGDTIYTSCFEWGFPQVAQDLPQKLLKCCSKKYIYCSLLFIGLMQNYNKSKFFSDILFATKSVTSFAKYFCPQLNPKKCTSIKDYASILILIKL